MNFSELSVRQQRILRYIVEFTQEHHYPPSIRQIGDNAGISSTSVVNYNLDKLEDYGLISRARDISRGLSVNYSQLLAWGFVRDANGGAHPMPDAIMPDAMKQSSRPPLPELEYVADDLEPLSAPEPELKPTPVMAPRFRLPLLGKIAAGNPIAVNPFQAYDPERWIDLTEDLMSLPVDRLFALRVEGNSMIDAGVLDGDIVILLHQETADDGAMVAAWIEGDEETTLKRLYRDGANVRLVPANPEYKPIVRAADKVQIKGEVVSIIRTYR
ncbi:MAG: LexA family protein [Caldilinea sp.]